MVPEVSTSLSCQACGAALRDEEIDDVRGVGRCVYCKAVTTLPNRSRVPLRVASARPAGVTVSESSHGLRLTRRWYHPRYLVLLVVAAFWFGILAMFFRISAAAGAPWFFGLFALLHVAAGVSLLYVALAGLLNSTVVQVDRDDLLTVQHGPLPWTKGASVPGRDLAQVFCVAKVYERNDGPPQRMFSVVAMTRTGERVPLVGGLITDVDHALYLEQVLEKYLRIPDRPVIGEVARAGMAAVETGP